MLEFDAEIKRTSQLKKASLDNEYQLLLVTDNSDILELGKLPPDVVVKVRVDYGKTNAINR